MGDEACACLTVRYDPPGYPDGSKTDRWRCRDCGRKFWPAGHPAATQPGDTERLLGLLRANGVTRYKRGDLEIELQGPQPQPDEWFGAWQELSPEELENEAKRRRERRGGGDSLGAGVAHVCDDPGTGNGAVASLAEQPAVEIDFAATEQLLREQDEKRRRASE